MRKIFVIILCFIMTVGLTSCGKKENEKAEVYLFAAKSLNRAMDEMIEEFKKENPQVQVYASYDSSGTLEKQIEEGAECDIFFSAATKQVKQLEEKELTVNGTRRDLLNNTLCVVAGKGNGTKVTGIGNLDKATNLALADASVPVGMYTRKALVKLGILDSEDCTTKEISVALGNLEINECINVGAVAVAVAEGSNEVGTVYYSDTYGYEDKLEIIEKVSDELCGAIIYPVVRIKNSSASKADEEAIRKLLEYIESAEAKKVFEKYRFISN